MYRFVIVLRWKFLAMKTRRLKRAHKPNSVHFEQTGKKTKKGEKPVDK